VIVADSSFIYALLDARDENHATATAWYGTVDDELATSLLVLSEVDHLAARVSPRALEAFRQDVVNDVYFVDWWPGAPRTIVGIADQYAALGLDLTDASLVAVASRSSTIRIATFDERHFRPVRPLTGEPAFTLLPLDAP
jgi:predicted nucleic acid-binding protein